ncbi:MAG: DUF4040 domain-containing protein [Candidatus Promineofilum sp.]|nr:DUF4040 domain-containing protein [Promineifilum sp.]MCW5861987.1 NADH-quinone oxidoreductase subunit J [Anaerolineae bacterium]
MSLHVLLLLAGVFCAGMAVRARPLTAALWLATLSAIIAIVLYRLGAHEVAVIELSVGAGLITVLLAFAISMAEDETMPTALVPRPFAWLLVLVAGGALLWLLLPALPAARQVATDAPFIIQVWENRLLDLVLQIVALIAGVMGVLSLLGETRTADATDRVDRADDAPTPRMEGGR